MYADEADAELDWYRCPNCLGQLEPVETDGFVALTCRHCSFVGERLPIPAAERPDGSDLPSFDGF